MTNKIPDYDRESPGPRRWLWAVIAAILLAAFYAYTSRVNWRMVP